MHSGGANRSRATRGGLNVDYSLDFLRQETNQYLDVPPDIAKGIPPHIQKLIGYSMPNPALGYYDAFKHPTESFKPARKPLNWATKHLLEQSTKARARL